MGCSDSYHTPSQRKKVTKEKIFALVDCNNFFVSCERIFRPDLADKPVVVMSSNDGCAVARSNEAKAVGIPMGAPMFKYKNTIEENNVVLFSANFHLYGDISRRITELLSSQIPIMEVYSIDESFLDISDIKIEDYERWGRELRDMIFRHIGVPVSIGIGPTKTLAKLASELAKKISNKNGVAILKPQDERLSEIKIEDIWGIGRKNAPKFRIEGFGNALDIANASRSKIRQITGSVMGERLFLELKGTACYNIKVTSKPQKMISATRTFGHDTNEINDVQSAIANLVARAGFNLRKDQQIAQRISIFVTSSRFKNNYSKNSKSLQLNYPSSNTGQLISVANQLFLDIFESHVQYHRAGVVLSDLVSEAKIPQIGLFDRDETLSQSDKNSFMKDVDSINKRYGREKIHYATQDISKKWLPRKRDVSPSYTTDWQQLPKIY